MSNWMQNTLSLSVCVGVAGPDQQILGTRASFVLINTMALLIGTKAFDVLDGRWRQPVDVGGRTAVAPDDVPLVGQTLISTKHAVKTECFLNI